MWYWDYEGQKLVDDVASTTPIASVTAYSRTILPLRVSLAEVLSDSDAIYGAVSMPAGHALRVGVKLASDLDAVDFLAQCLAFTASEDDAHSGDLNLNTAAVNAALDEAGDDEIACKLELSLWRSADGVYAHTHQVDLTIKRKVITGDEAGAAALVYAAAFYTNPDDGRKGVRLLNEDGIPCATFYP